MRIPRSKRAFGVVLRRPSVVVATLTGLLLIGACAAVEASVTSVFGEGSPNAGIVLAVFAIGSLVGGLAFGHRPISPNTLWTRMAIVFVGLALAVGGTNFWWLCLALLIAVAASPGPRRDVRLGVGDGEVLRHRRGLRLDGHRPAHRRGWRFRCGRVPHRPARPDGGLMVGAGMALVGVLLPLAAKQWLPDLRGRDASPIPDTEPVNLPT